MSSYKLMRVVVMFDLPTQTREERKVATSFRKFLLDDGFDMLQYSVYSRFCVNRDHANKHIERVKKSAPDTGSIRCLFITENQFTNMYIFSGEKTIQEDKKLTKQLAFF